MVRVEDRYTMQAGDKLEKSSWILLQGIKDSVTNNVYTAVKSGQLQIEAKVLPMLLMLLNSSMEEGYHKGFKTFMKAANQSADSTQPVKTSKKK